MGIMKRDFERDRIISVFYRYARLGLADEKNALCVILRIYGSCGKGGALDMLAVFDTLRLLRYLGKTDVLLAIRRVYFDCARHPSSLNDVTYAIRRLSFEINADERTIYRQLAKARSIWSAVRAELDCSSIPSRCDISRCTEISEEW